MVTGDAFETLKSALADRYAIERELGRGGMAVVYLARDLKHDRQVAIKVLTAEVAEGVKTDRFTREIQLAGKLSHTNILPLYDSGEAGGSLFYVMPYVEGESLRDRVDREKRLPVEAAVQITREVAEALSYAHEQGVVHRDIKPENIMLLRGHAVVMDFGIARALSAAQGQTVTQTGTMVGTPLYMSPEQASGGAVDRRSDIYSLGCVLYEMLAGHPPFTGQNTQEVLGRHMMDAVPGLKAARAGIPGSIEGAIQKALAKQPEDRFATAVQFIQALSAPSAGVRPRRRSVAYLSVGLVVLLGASAVVVRGFRRVPTAPSPERSIAVLPFVNFGDSTQEYFSDGMTEELINALTQVEGLRVPARTSSFAFKGKNTDVKQIGRQLVVAHVLEGSVRRVETLLRVTAQLINVADGYHLWSQTYEREVRSARDVFAIQEELSRAIVNALQVKLAAGENSALVPRHTENLEAYQLYLKGRFFWNRGGEEGLNRAREFFSAAIAQDSGYARAYAGLADAYERLLFLRYLPRAEAYPKARAAADRAVALDPQLAEAYASRGVIRHRHEWDWSRAEEDFRRAVALNPGYALGHLWHGVMMGNQGRFPEAIREASRAAELDPLSSPVLLNYRLVLVYAGQYGPAAEQARKALELQPSAEGHQGVGEAYLFQGKFADAIQEFQTALDLLGGRGRVFPNLARVGFAYARAGRRDQALKILEDMKRRVASGDKPLIGHEHALALLYTGLGEKDQAFEWLARAYQAHDQNQTALRVSPFFDPLRSDPRFKELLKKVGLGA